MYRTVAAATLTLLFVVVGFALVVPMASAQGTECGGEGQPTCPSPGCGGEGQPACEVCGGEGQPACLCHNIGGPRDLGANCDATGNCSFTTNAGTITVGPNQFLGILIGAPTSGPALAAHLAHGDGTVIQAIFDPPLHLASVNTGGQNHQAANVECLAIRAVPQPPDHGN